jgi:hypothetical protein
MKGVKKVTKVMNTRNQSNKKGINKVSTNQGTSAYKKGGKIKKCKCGC